MKLKKTLVIIGLMFLTACKNQVVSVTNLKPLPQDNFIQVYFNYNQAKGAEYVEPYRQISRSGDNLEQIIIDHINQAQVSIDIAVQELRLPQIAQALAQKKQQGVNVRVILENSYNIPFSSLTQAGINQLDSREKSRYQNEFIALVDTNKDGQITPEEIRQGDALIILKNVGIPIIDDTEDGSKGSGLMHHKFIVIDQKIVVTGSANFTASDIHGDFSNTETRGNANHILVINDANLANLFTREFNQMWGDGMRGKTESKFGLQKNFKDVSKLTIGDSKIKLKFSPNSPTQPWNLTTNGLIGETVGKTLNNIDLALFVFSEQKIADILQQKYHNNATIRVLIDPDFAFQYYSEALDLSGVALANKCQYETNNNPWSKPINTVGIPNLPRGDKLHHKFAVIDQKTVITGSHNWSAAANYKNDETLLVIENPVIAAHFVREFDRLYSNAILGIPDTIKTQIQQQEKDCSNLSQNISTQTQTQATLINLNTASQKELQSLPGIGPKIAEKIIEARGEKPFTSLEDFDQRVSGVGSKMIQNIEDKVTF
jgi:competence ComEA-like helix-hairpin-helix protein